MQTNRSLKIGEVSQGQFDDYRRVWGLVGGCDMGMNPLDQSQAYYEKALAGLERMDLKGGFEALQQAAKIIGLHQGQEAGRMRARIMLAQGRIFATSGSWRAALSCFQEASRLAERWNEPFLREAAKRGESLSQHQLSGKIAA
ncbi:MAG: hypothetical protein K1Y36_30085 [Blastocatellia bacterium]|nr:hypothetical protein [Blastocatellia bacterium]